MRTQNERDGVIYISGVMDEETRPVVFSALEDLKPGEGMLVIFRLPKGASSDQLLEFNIKDFSPSSQWDSVSDKSVGGVMQGVVMNLAEQVNKKRLPNILFSQGDEKVKATDDHTVCFGIMGGAHSGKITKIKTIVHQQLNMGLNGDLLLHESNLIMSALYNNRVIVKDAPLSIRSYGAGGSSSHNVHPGDILTSDAVIDIRTHVNPIYSITYLKKYLDEAAHLSSEDPEFLNEIESIIANIKEKFSEDPSYSGLAIVSDIEALINAISRLTGTAPKDILAGMDPKEKEYYGEISVSNSSQGTRTIKRIINPSFVGDEGQKVAKKEIVSFMNKMGEHEALNAEISHLRKKIKRVNRKFLPHAVRHEVNERQRKNNPEISLSQKDLPLLKEESLIEVAHTAIYKKLSKQKKALAEALDQALIKKDELLIERDIESKCSFLRSEINQLKDIQRNINPDHPFVVTASGNIFFNHAEKQSVHQFGAALVEMENQLFKQTIHKAIMDGCYVQNELVTKIAADPVCIPREATARLNTWAKTCTMTLDDYVSAYMWTSAGKKQDMNNIPSSGLWSPANQIVKLKYPCGIIKIDANPLEMPRIELKELLGNTPSYIVYQDKFFYADEVLDVEDLGPATDETRALTIALRLPYDDSVSSSIHCSLFREINPQEQNKIERVTKHRHRATYERLFYSLLVPQDSSQIENESVSSETSVDTSQILNPFWKEIGVDLLSEIGNRKAFSGSIFKDTNEADRSLQEQLQERANIISRLQEPDAIAVRALFHDYLTYMMSKIPSAELEARGMSAEKDRYPVYARNAIYKTGYVSGPVTDWDAAIYKSNNSAVLVGIVDKFLRDKPVSAVHSEAVIVYQGPDKKRHDLAPHQQSEHGRRPSHRDKKIGHDSASFALPLPIQSLIGAMDLLLKLQEHPKLEPHHQESLEKLLNTLLKQWDQVAEDGNSQKKLQVFCTESKKAINTANKVFKHEGILFNLIRPLLNLFIQGINLIQHLIFKEPKSLKLFKKSPTNEQIEQWNKIHQALGKLWENCLKPEAEVSNAQPTQLAK